MIYDERFASENVKQFLHLSTTHFQRILAEQFAQHIFMQNDSYQKKNTDAPTTAAEFQ